MFADSHAAFCPPKTKSSTTMELPFFKKVVEELSPYTDEIALHVMGDPMVLSNWESI
jgi:hypothetical protein